MHRKAKHGDGITHHKKHREKIGHKSTTRQIHQGPGTVKQLKKIRKKATRKHTR